MQLKLRFGRAIGVKEMKKLSWMNKEEKKKKGEFKGDRDVSQGSPTGRKDKKWIQKLQ